MPLSSGSILGPYQIVEAIGAGGMGEVYRARDTKLNRQVALKVLPDLFASDPERLARLKREAQALAALNHPNIAHIHGFEDSTRVHALVMELVDGPTLADRLATGPLPIDEAIPVARQIAEALVAAHDQGIIHRDLKPANIKLRDDGTVKVLDFGLAKLAPEPGNSEGMTAELPTITTPALTLAGVILGTAAYMSPEQTKGRPADKRSDVWAFGAVGYEMLTARRAFDGDDVSDTLANVLKGEPDWTALPPAVPPHIRRMLQQCLVKDPRRRLANMGVALFVLNDDGAPGSVLVPTNAAGAMSSQSPLWRRLLIPAVAVVATAAAVAAPIWLVTRPDPPAVTRFAFANTGSNPLAVDAQSRDLTITPDGTRVVYKGAAGTNVQLFVRALDSLETTPLLRSGTQRAPFISPDGQWVGFVEPSPIMLGKVPLTGGSPEMLLALDGASRGATWTEDNNIIFGTALTATGLQRISGNGGQREILTTPDRQRGEADHLWPQMLPGNQAVLFTITPLNGNIDASQIAVLDLRDPKRPPRIVLRGGSQAKYVSSGHLVYASGGALRAVPFDLDKREAIGTPVPVQSGIVTMPTGTAEFDISANGTLVYATGGAGFAPPRTLVWVDRQGREEPVKGALPLRSYVSPRLSPDGSRIAVDAIDEANDIWVWDLNRRTLSRVSTDPGLDQTPAWMPNGRQVLYSSQSEGLFRIARQSADSTGSVEFLATTGNPVRLSGASHDGTRIFLSQASAGTGVDLMVLNLDKQNALAPLVQTQFAEKNAELSPDGRWLAYEANDTNQFQIYVRPWPDYDRERIQLTTAGGMQPQWSRDSQELFYLEGTGAIVSVRVGQGATWSASPGTRTPLAANTYFLGSGGGATRAYDVTPDGKRFLMIKEAGAGSQPSAATSIVVVRNWIEELKRLVPRR